MTHTTLSDDVEVFSRAEYLPSNTFKKQRNSIMTDGVMLFPVCAHHVIKNKLSQLTFFTQNHYKFQLNCVTGELKSCMLPLILALKVKGQMCLLLFTLQNQLR